MGFKLRALSWFIDMSLCIILSALLTWILAITYNLNDIDVLTLLNLFNFSLSFTYFWFSEAYNKGQTLGKMLLNIMTVDADTLKPTNLGSYAINNFTRGSFFFLLDILFGLIANRNKPEKRIRITQNAANTVVIRKK